MIASGVHHMTAEDYHAGNGDDAIRLSQSIAHILCVSSPRHAWFFHPKLNPDYQPRVDDGRFDIGTTAHAILLDGRDIDDVVHEVEAPDWRTGGAKEARDFARSVGKVPLLTHQRSEVLAMVQAARKQLAEHDAKPPPLTDGVPEASLLWEEDGVFCKARLDWLRTDLAAVDDLKTTSRSASPAAYSRNLFGVGGDVQAAFYLRGVQQLMRQLGGVAFEPEFRWVVVETSPPYALSVVAPDPSILDLGRRKVDWALKLWRECMESGQWPGYPRQVAYAEAPGYEEERWLERELVAS